jgi:hypothetical protein
MECIFHHNIRIIKNPFTFQDFFFIKTFLGMQDHNEFKISDLFVRVNIYHEPWTDYWLKTHQKL